MLTFDDIESPDAGSDVNTNHLCVPRANLQTGHRQRLVRRRDGEVDESSHLLDFFFLDEFERVEIFYFGRDLAGELGNIKKRAVNFFELVDLGDSAYAAFTCKQVLPHFFRSVTHSADQADSSDYDTSCQIYLPPFACLPT